MDLAAVDSVDHLEKDGSKNLVSVASDKRKMDCDGDENLGVKKKVKVDDSNGDMKRIAEIVLVLSTMGKMRGGRNPTDFEKGLMVEAREKLTTICEAFSPEDIISRDAVRVVIEDLGLNKLKDQRSGFRLPRMSISDKFLLAKKKMEESKKFAAQSAAYSSQSHLTMLHTSQKYPSEKPSTSAVPIVGLQAASPVVQESAQAATPSLKPVNGVQSATVSRGLVGAALQNNSSSLPLPQAEGAPFRLEGRVNGSLYGANVQVGKVVQGNKIPDHIIKVEGTTEVSTSKVLHVTSDQNLRPPVVQNAHGNFNLHQPSPTTSHSAFPKHNDIAKNVQKVLQPTVPQRPNWTPPSTDYMNKSLTCQICKITINDVESLLVCDACEKGVHLKCLQSYNQKRIPLGEWHCPKCLVSSNGKPLPPKYGRVTRSITTQRVLEKTGKVQASSEKVGTPNQNVNPQKITSNANFSGQSLANVGSYGSYKSGSVADLKASNSTEILGLKAVSKETKGVCDPSDRGNGSSIQHPYSSKSSPCQLEASIDETKPPPNVQSGPSAHDEPSNPSVSTCNSSNATCNTQEVDTAEHPSNTEAVRENQEIKPSDLRDTSDRKRACSVRQDDPDCAQVVSFGALDAGNDAKNCTRSSLDWVGDVLQVVDEKAFYNSCHINGIVYKLQDHALFCSSNDSLRPSKIQALWEDTKTGSKWAVVNRCYLPDDLPEVVGRPCTPDNNEVYESNHGSTVRVSLVQGPCEVLSPIKFKKECERRTCLDQGTTDGLQPVFLCKWFYDESKGIFRAVAD